MRFDFAWLRALAILMLAPPVLAETRVDPLTAIVDVQDAERFAALFARTDGRPTADQLQREYLDKGSEGVRIFTPGRIENAAALADYVAANREQYRRAIDHCLPLARQSQADLRAIYLALRGLYPDRPLPRIYIVLGRGNSGGTANPEAQVLGLEVLCDPLPEPAAFRQRLRMFFAHETVHTWQPANSGKETNLLLRAALAEGAADYVASLVLGAAPSPEREAWAAPREAEVWQEFLRDVAATRLLSDAQYEGNKPAMAAIRRWIGNYGAAPEGWPFEMGYWVGMRIWQRYVAAATDKKAAIETVLRWTDPEDILAAGGFKP